MAFEGYMSFKGKTQGQFKGSVPRTQGGHPSSSGHTPILSFRYAVCEPHDASSGLASGRRTHTPIEITREVDSSSPVLLQACLTHAPFDAAELILPKPSAGRGVVLHNKIELTNGTITQISFAPARNGKRRETVTLEYEGITVNGAPGSPESPQPLWWHDSR